MKLTPGSRWMSAVCNTEVVVVRAPSAEVSLSCGGTSMLPIGSARGDATPAPDRSGTTLLGKRYTDGASGLEVLCTKAGQGLLSIDDRMLVIRATTPLPSSD